MVPVATSAQTNPYAPVVSVWPNVLPSHPPIVLVPVYLFKQPPNTAVNVATPAVVEPCVLKENVLVLQDNKVVMVVVWIFKPITSIVVLAKRNAVQMTRCVLKVAV